LIHLCISASLREPILIPRKVAKPQGKPQEFMILVFIEHRNCVLNKTSLEAITAAQNIAKDLGLKVLAVIPCDKQCSFANEIAGYDLEKIIIAKNEKLATYTPDGYADALEQVIRATNPQYVVMAHTYQVRDFAPKIAARLGRELVGDCIRYRAAPTTPSAEAAATPPQAGGELRRVPPLLRKEGSLMIILPTVLH